MQISKQNHLQSVNDWNHLCVPRTEVHIEMSETRVNEKDNEEEGVDNSKTAEQLVEGRDDIVARDDNDGGDVGDYSQHAETCKKDALDEKLLTSL